MLDPALEVKRKLAARAPIKSLRDQIERIGGRSRRLKSVLPFGINEICLTAPRRRPDTRRAARNRLRR